MLRIGVMESYDKKKQKWEQGWVDLMAEIWIEKMWQFNPPIHLTGNLQESIKGNLHPGPVTTIEERFAQYGIFVAKGVTPSYAWKKWTKAQGGTKEPRQRMSGGQLEILDPRYRHEHGLDKGKKTGPMFGGRSVPVMPVGRRDWFGKKFYASLMKLNEYEATFYGESYNGMMNEALNMMFHGGDSILGRTLQHLL